MYASMYACMYVCLYVVRMHIVRLYKYKYVVHQHVFQYVHNVSTMYL